MIRWGGAKFSHITPERKRGLGFWCVGLKPRTVSSYICVTYNYIRIRVIYVLQDRLSWSLNTILTLPLNLNRYNKVKIGLKSI
jgi:hypothetical protein